MSDEIWDALSSEGDFSPIFKFTDPGDRIKGIIVEPPTTLPLTEYNSDKVKHDADGNPVMQVLLLLATEQRADENHDGRWRVYLDKPLLKAAVLRGLKDAGASSLEVGGELSIEFTGWRQTGGFSAKDFTAKYFSVQQSGPIGTGELGETTADDEPPF